MERLGGTGKGDDGGGIESFDVGEGIAQSLIPIEEVAPAAGNDVVAETNLFLGSAEFRGVRGCGTLRRVNAYPMGNDACGGGTPLSVAAGADGADFFLPGSVCGLTSIPVNPFT